MYQNMRALRREIRDYAEEMKGKLYFADYAVCEILSRPFSKYIPDRYGINLIGTLPLVMSKETDVRLSEFGLSPTNTISDICKAESLARFLLTGHTYTRPFDAVVRAIGYYMREEGKDIGVFSTEIRKGWTYEIQFKELSQLQKEWVAYKKNAANIVNANDLVAEASFFVMKCLGRDGSRKEFKKVYGDIMNFSVADDDYSSKRN
jgi:hypothetical protein